MKTQVKIGFVTALVLMSSMLTALGSSKSVFQDNEVPGDHFSLEGALELFKKSKSPEDFERMLNVADSRVNNLDLNGDGDIDYIKVIDRHDRNVHAFILQAVISPAEYQDVAVIELEILADGEAVLQIVGDKDIYGIETIIEPTEEVRVNAGATTRRTYVNVWAWPSVQYVYDPYYVSWISPWDWYSRPIWWRPWRPVTYVVYRPYWDPYRPYYSVCHTRRVYYAHTIYHPIRRTSVIVHDRHYRQIEYSRATRGRDSYYREAWDNDRRGRDSYSSNNDRSNNGRSYDRSRQSSTNDRESGSRSGRQRSDNVLAPTQNRSESRSGAETSRPRTTQESRDRSEWSAQPRINTDQPDRQPDRTPRARPQMGGSEREARPAGNPRPSAAPRTETPRSTPAPRPSVQPSHSGGRSQQVDVPRSAPRQERSNSTGSSGSGSKKRGRE